MVVSDHGSRAEAGQTYQRRRQRYHDEQRRHDAAEQRHAIVAQTQP
jgi:hypothetical protein